MKKGQMWDTFIPWMIGLIVLALVLGLYFILKDKGIDIVSFMKDLMRFR